MTPSVLRRLRRVHRTVRARPPTIATVTATVIITDVTHTNFQHQKRHDNTFKCSMSAFSAADLYETNNNIIATQRSTHTIAISRALRALAAMRSTNRGTMILESSTHANQFSMLHTTAHTHPAVRTSALTTRATRRHRRRGARAARRLVRAPSPHAAAARCASASLRRARARRRTQSRDR
jgi:hypothetical protein